MNNVYFYLLLGVLLYFIFTRVLERFSQEQENFDPSLVPVSSIVTLAKVAQKLVNGNGTLTNPGNLQIGANAATPGNLTVTGNTTVGGKATISSGINATGGDTFGFNGSGGGQTLTGSIVTNTLGIGRGWQGSDIIASNNNEKDLIITANKGVSILGCNFNAGTINAGNTNVGGTLGVTGNTTVDGVLNLRAASSNSNGQINDKDGVSRLLFFDPDKNTYYDSGSGNVHHFRGHKGAEGTNVNVHGNLSTSNKLILNNPNPILLAGDQDYHYIRYDGTPDGPIVSGNSGGALGTGKLNNFKAALKWDNNNNVTVPGNVNASTASGIRFSDGSNCVSNLKMPTIPGMYIFTLLNYDNDWLGVWHIALYVDSNNKMAYHDVYNNTGDRNRSSLYQDNSKVGNMTGGVPRSDNPPPNNLYLGIDGWYQGPPAGTGSKKVVATWSKLANY